MVEREQIERFFRKRILQELSSGRKPDGETLINEAQFELNLHGEEDGLILSIILNDVWEMMNIGKMERPKEQKEENEKPRINDTKMRILSYLYDNPDATLEQMSKDLNIDLDVLQKLYDEAGVRVKKRFSPRQKAQIVDITIDLLSHYPNATIDDLEEILFEVFESKVNARNILARKSLELEKKGDKETAKMLQEFLKRSARAKSTDDEER